jgi:hypothetical protein
MTRIFNLTLVVVLLSTPLLAQPFIPSLYSLEAGSRVYFVPSHNLTFRGQEYSEEYTLDFDLWASILTPLANFTATHYPTKYLQNDFSSLSLSKHRLDAELKYWPVPFNPVLTLEMVNLEFYTSDWDDRSKLFQSKTESKFGVYGGMGGAITTKLTDDVDVKGVTVFRMLNQTGWEFGFNTLWRTPRIFTVDSHLVGGIQFKDFQFEWGRSKGYGFMLELGLSF